MELGSSLKDLLNRSRPIYENVDHNNVIVSVGRNVFRRRATIVPECMEDQTNIHAQSSALRDIFKWQYHIYSGESWSLRNRGARRGFQQFMRLWEMFYDKVKEADDKGKRFECHSEEVESVVNDLNTLLQLVDAGRHDKDAVVSFCDKVFDDKVLKRVKYFVDDCTVCEY